MALDRKAAIFFEIERHLKTEHGATIEIPKAFGIPAPAVYKKFISPSYKHWMVAFLVDP